MQGRGRVWRMLLWYEDYEERCEGWGKGEIAEPFKEEEEAFYLAHWEPCIRMAKGLVQTVNRVCFLCDEGYMIEYDYQEGHGIYVIRFPEDVALPRSSVVGREPSLKAAFSTVDTFIERTNHDWEREGYAVA